MSRENVEVVLQGYEAWNHGDFEFMLERISPDWRFETPQLFSDDEPVYEGREGFLKFRDIFTAAWESVQIELERTEDLGDKVLALFTLHGKGRGSGVEVSIPFAHLHTLREGRAVHLLGFASWDEALEAAGLRE
jgi:ketosteroid isomerase-like protein